MRVVSIERLSSDSCVGANAPDTNFRIVQTNIHSPSYLKAQIAMKPACKAGSPNCFMQQVFLTADCSGAPNATVYIPADGKCAAYPGAIGGNGPGSTPQDPVWVSSITCDASTKLLHGIGLGSSCSGTRVVGGTPVIESFDGSCVGHDGFYAKTTGTCGNPPVTVRYEWDSITADTWRDTCSNPFVPKNNVITGVKVWKDSTYVTVPRWFPGVPSTLNKVVEEDGTLEPWPSCEMQKIERKPRKS